MHVVKRSTKMVLNALNHLMRSRSAPVLLVASDPASRKVNEIVSRLAAYAPGAQHRVVSRASLLDLLRSFLVLEVDVGAVAGRYRHSMSNVCRVDYERNFVDGWELCRLAQRWDGLPSTDRRREAAARLRSAVTAVQASGKSRTYVFGTGSSLARALESDFSDGHVIVCNTIVRDRDLWHHLRPDFLVAGDAIYHFGNTAHARAFRADARNRLLESRGKTYFVYPELFDAVVRREFADLGDLLIPVPVGSHTSIHVDLTERFESPGLGNVLNLLLLPLGCTLSRSIWLWGFDGRAPTDKLFWANSNRHSYPELMAGLQEAHPAFFSALVPPGRENQYVTDVHGDLLDQRLAAAERLGYSFHMMHFSWTETLNKRAATNRAEERGDSDG